MSRPNPTMRASACGPALLALAASTALSASERPASERPATEPVAVAGMTYVKSRGGIHEYRLDANQLTILLVPDHSAPVTGFNVTYRVGSRNEVTGTTGATHLLEHLMFKGTDKYNGQAGTGIDQYLERVGARFNATTWWDRTNYFAALGKADLDGYVAIESDRMRNLWLREEDRKAEMTVVRNEFERGKNDPHAVLFEEVTATAYQALPYHHSTIGWRSDIENVPIEKLRAFYDTFYWPNNATVILVGDFETGSALRMIGKYYGGYQKSPQPIPTIYTEEPQQTGPRRVTLKRPGELGSVVVAHKVPDARHQDIAAIAVLDAILGAGKSSRLYRSLVDSGLALEAGAYTPFTYDLALHTTSAYLAPGATHAKAEAALLAEIEKVKTSGVTKEELARVKEQYAASQDYKRDGIAGVLSELNEWVAAGEWTRYITLPEDIARVTAADVQRVARLYLTEDTSTTGWFVPVTSVAATAAVQ